MKTSLILTVIFMIAAFALSIYDNHTDHAYHEFIDLIKTSFITAGGMTLAWALWYTL